MPEQISNHLTDDLQDDIKAAMVEVAGEPEAKSGSEVKSEPEVKTEERTDTRKRDESGRFKAGSEESKEETVEKPAEIKPVETKAPEAPTEIKPQEVKATAPPLGWSIKAKAEWDKLPQHVREAIGQRETAIDSGYKDLEGLRPYRERAKATGQTLQQVLQNYTGIEDLLRNDPRSGYLRIASNSGMTQHQAAQFFAGLAQDLGHQIAPTNQNGFGGSPADQNAGADPNALYQMFRPMVDPLMQEVQQLKATIAQQTEAERGQRLATASSVIEVFRQDPAHRYYDDVEPVIGDLLSGGIVKRTGDLAADLARAYDYACRLNPEISEVLTNERVTAAAEEKAKAAKEAADKARAASKSVSGSPSPGASAVSKTSNASHEDDIYADVRAAMNSARA